MAGQKDSCPKCRQKLHSGTYGDPVGDLVAEAEAFAYHAHSPETPADDRRALIVVLMLTNNLNQLGPYSGGAVGERVQTAINYLEMARVRWYYSDRDHFTVPIGGPRIDPLQAYNVVLVQGYRLYPILWRMCDTLCMQSIDDTAPGAFEHVATHPLARRAVHAIPTQLLRHEATNVTLPILQDMLYQAIADVSCLTGIMDGNMSRSDFPRSLTWFLQDMINIVLSHMLDWQREGTFIVLPPT